MYKKLNKYQNGNGDSNANQVDSLRNVDLVNKRLLDYIPQQYQGDINIDEDDPFYGTPNFLKNLSQDQIDMIVDNYDMMINPNPDPNNPILTDSLYFNPFTLEMIDERNPFVDGAQSMLNLRNDSILNIYGDLIQDAYESGRFDKLYQDGTLKNPMDNTNVNLSDTDRIQQQLAPYNEMILTGDPQTWGVDGAIEKNQANRNAKTITSYLWDGIKGAGKFIGRNPMTYFLYENIDAIVNDEEPYWYYDMILDQYSDPDPMERMMNYGSELRKAQDGNGDNPYEQNIIYSGDDGMVYAFPGDEGYPIMDTRVGQNVDDKGYAVPQFLYSDTTGVDVINKYKNFLESSGFGVPAPGGPPPTPFVYEEKEPILEPIDYASTAYELATPGVVSSLFPYAMFKGTEAAVTGTHNYLMENDENYRQLNNSLDSNDAKTKSQGLNFLGQIFGGINPRFGLKEGGSLANYGDEIVDLVTPQKNPNIQNIYEGDDRFTISKMEREKEKTDKLFQEQQDYLYDDSGFLNPNLDLSKNPLRNKKYTLYNPYSEEMFYDPMNPTKLFTETEYGEYQDDMTTTRTIAALNQRADMYPELFQKVTDFDPETKEITYAGDKLEGDLFSDANPDSAYLQYTTPEGEESGSFTGSLVSDVEGDITGPVYDPFDQYENDEGTYTFMEAEAKYGGIPKAQLGLGKLGSKFLKWLKGADDAANVTKTFLNKGDNLNSYNDMVTRGFKMNLESPLTREAIQNYKTKFPLNFGASDELAATTKDSKEVIEALGYDAITKKSNLLDDYIKKNPSYSTTADDFKYLGNMDGRQIVSVDTPVGTQYFYKSSGLAGKKGSKDMWVPLEGFLDDTSGMAVNRLKGNPDWFMKRGSVGTYKGQPIETISFPDNTTKGVKQQLIDMGVDPTEALRSGDLVLDQPGWDFMYTTNPNAFYNKLSNQLDRVTQEKGWGVLDKTTRAHGGPHTEEEWEKWRQERENYENDRLNRANIVHEDMDNTFYSLPDNESVNSEFNYYDDIAPGSYDSSIMDNMYFADQFQEKIEEDPDDEFEFADPNKPVMNVKDEERKPGDFNFKPFEALVTGLGAVNQMLENRPEQNYNNQLAGNQFQADTRDSRGFYDVNTGILNPDRNVVERQAAYGGRTDQLRNREYDDIDTTIELDEGTIQELIAAGAEIEIL